MNRQPVPHHFLLKGYKGRVGGTVPTLSYPLDMMGSTLECSQHSLGA